MMRLARISAAAALALSACSSKEGRTMLMKQDAPVKSPAPSVATGTVETATFALG